jgi:hypothetical protein
MRSKCADAGVNHEGATMLIAASAKQARLLGQAALPA